MHCIVAAVASNTAAVDITIGGVAEDTVTEGVAVVADIPSRLFAVLVTDANSPSFAEHTIVSTVNPDSVGIPFPSCDQLVKMCDY